MNIYPDDNPKTILGVSKPGIKAVPASALYYLGQAMADGERKYGLYNYREKRVSSSIYFEAAQRHWWSWWDGEDCAQDSNIHHLAHAMACAAIVLDAYELRQLNDDRGQKGNVSDIIRRWTKVQKD